MPAPQVDKDEDYIPHPSAASDIDLFEGEEYANRPLENSEVTTTRKHPMELGTLMGTLVIQMFSIANTGTSMHVEHPRVDGTGSEHLRTYWFHEASI